MKTALALLLVTTMAVAAPAGAVEAHYEAYAAGVDVISVDANIAVDAGTYRVAVGYRTVGAFGLLLRSAQQTTANGRFVADRAVPERFYSAGTLRGDPRVTQIDYSAGQPTLRQLSPPNDTEREPVPAAQQADTVDTLSAMAELIHRVNTSGRCDGRVMTFDGRRLSVLEARTEGPQPLEASSRSSFAGPTLRCSFVGRQLAGFLLGEDRERLARPQEGTAWFAATVPGGPMIPVRIAFRTRWFGEATMYLAARP